MSTQHGEGMSRQREEENYFQTIASRFYQLRGSPFFLSAKEISFVESWRERDIPLAVVLDGIKLAYENYRRRAHKKSRTFSLSFCHDHVIKAYYQYRERKVGKREILPHPDKQDKVRTECEDFLRRVPEQVVYLRNVFAQILEEFTEGTIEENKLEQYEEEIETLIAQNASPDEKEDMTKDVQAEYRVPDQQEWNRIFRIRLIKKMREKYRVPHVSLFYY